MSLFRVFVKAGYNLIGFNRKALMDDDRPVTKRDLNQPKQELLFRQGLEHGLRHLADSLTR